MAATPFEAAPALLGMDLWHGMGVNLLAATDTYDVLSAGIEGRPIDYGSSGHPLLDPLEFGNLSAADFPKQYRVEPLEEAPTVGCFAQRGGAFGAATMGRCSSRAAPLGFVVFHLAVETRNKKNCWKSGFLFRPGPTFGPKLKPTLGGAGP